MAARGATEPIRDRGPEATRRRRDREHDVQTQIVGLAERAVELVRVRNRVDRTGERDERGG